MLQQGIMYQGKPIFTFSEPDNLRLEQDGAEWYVEQVSQYTSTMADGAKSDFYMTETNKGASGGKFTTVRQNVMEFF